MNLNDIMPGRKESLSKIHELKHEIIHEEFLIHQLERNIWVRIVSICEHDFQEFGRNHNGYVYVCDKCGLKEEDFRSREKDFWDYSPATYTQQYNSFTKENIRKIKIEKILNEK